MPIIETPSPWTAASSAIGGFVDERNKQADIKKRDEQQAFQNQRAIQSEQFDAQRMALEQKRFDEQHRQALANEESTKMEMELQKATLEHNKATWPIAEAIQKANLQGTLDQNMIQKATFAAAQADDAFFKKTVGMTGSQAVAMSKLKEAQATIAARAAAAQHAQAATQQGWARIGMEGANLGERRRHDQSMEGIAGAGLDVRKAGLGLAGERLRMERERLTDTEQTSKLNRLHTQALIQKLNSPAAASAKLTPKMAILRDAIKTMAKAHPNATPKQIRDAAKTRGYTDQELDTLIPADPAFAEWGDINPPETP